MKIKIEKLPSGFYCVRVNSRWIDASSATLEQAEEKARKIIESENRKQNKRKCFTNIELKIVDN